MNDKRNLYIRELSQKDLQQVADIHQGAFPDSYLSRINQEAIIKYYDWHMQPPNDCYAIGAFDSQNLLGYCFAGSFRNAEYYFILQNWFFFLKFFITHPSFFFHLNIPRRIIKFGAYLKEYASRKIKNNNSEKLSGSPNRFGILSIGVDPKRQRSGVGKALMDEIKKVAIGKGYQKISLSVHPDNHPAVRFYEKNGWQKVVHKKEQGWQGYMEKTLF